MSMPNQGIGGMTGVEVTAEVTAEVAILCLAFCGVRLRWGTSLSAGWDTPSNRFAAEGVACPLVRGCKEEVKLMTCGWGQQSHELMA